MRQNKKKGTTKVFEAPKRRKSPDEELTEHLTQAEDHLIEAVKLFSGPRRAIRDLGYQKRLEGAQTTVTGLLRQELVRARGPLKEPKKRTRQNKPV